MLLGSGVPPQHTSPGEGSAGASAEAVAANPSGAALAASGMWALAYHGEKVKAAIRRVPSAPKRLVAAYASSRFAKDRVRAQRDRIAALERGYMRETVGAEAGRPEAAGAGAASAGRPDLLLAKAVGDAREPDWAALASSQLSGLLTALQATSAADAPQGNLLPPDRLPQRE